jgi:hypothetical protein
MYYTGKLVQVIIIEGTQLCEALDMVLLCNLYKALTRCSE